jgi:dephospho-CoA kinase
MDKLSIPEDKFIIGLTGNIATGKSTVMNLAIERGALALDADKIVHEILDGNVVVQEAIANMFGSTVREADGRIIRPALGKIVFGDAQALRDLEAIIHPAVHRQMMSRIKESHSSIVMIEAIKLLEGKLREICHTIWVTRCSRERQLERLRICRGMDEESAVMRVDSQAPQKEKVLQANVVIDTDGLMNDTRRQFVQAWSRIPQLSGS